MKTILIFPFLILTLCTACLGQDFNLIYKTITEDDASIIYGNYLVLEHRPPLYLAPTKKHKKPIKYDAPYGLNEKSIKLKYIPESKYVTISWDSFGHGSGHYINSGFLLVEFIPNDLIVLFRDIRQTRARGGWRSSTYSNLEFDVRQNNLTILLKSKNCRGDTKPHPSYIFMGNHDEGNDIYGCSYTLIKAWEYRIENHYLIFDKDHMGLQLDGTYSRNELSDALALNIVSENEHVTGDVQVSNYLGPYMFHNASPYGGSK